MTRLCVDCGVDITSTDKRFRRCGNCSQNRYSAAGTNYAKVEVFLENGDAFEHIGRIFVKEEGIFTVITDMGDGVRHLYKTDAVLRIVEELQGDRD